LLLCAISMQAQAAEPSSTWGQPLFLWGVMRSDGSQDFGVTSAIRQRLLQGGLSVLSLPESMAGIECTTAECPQRLKEAGGLASGRIMGAYFDAPSGQGADILRKAHIFWLDKATGKLIERSLSCQGCDLSERLAREAAFLVEQAPSASPKISADCEPPTSADSESSAAPAPLAQGALSGLVTLSVSATMGAKAPSKNLTSELQNALLQMGVHTVLSMPSGGARLTVELQGSPEPHKHSSTIETVFLSLTGRGLSRQMRFYCPPDSCGRDLLRFLRTNISALLDGAEPEQAYTPGTAIACLVPPGIKVASLTPVVAQATPDPSIPAAGSPAAAVVTSDPGYSASPVPPLPSSNSSSCPVPNRRFLVAGGVLAGVGLAAVLAFGITYGVLNGNTQPLSPTNNMLFPLQVTDASPALAGVAIGGASTVVGGILIGLYYRSYNRGKGTEGTCVPK
jgi:hypothetical protein